MSLLCMTAITIVYVATVSAGNVATLLDYDYR
jgi:hypothetical protein